MNRKAFFSTAKHGDISGEMVYFQSDNGVSGVWLHKNVFIEVCRRRGKSILPELMAKLLEERKEAKK